MRKIWRGILCAAVCCLLLSGCLQIKERGSVSDKETETTTETQAVANLNDYTRVEAELAEQARRIAAFETRLAELEAKREAVETDTSEPGSEQNTKTEESAPRDPETLYRYIVSDDGYATVTSYLGVEETVVIPSTLGGYPVVAVGEEAFKNGSAAAVVIPSGVRRVDWFAFGGCYRLASVTVPDSVVAIGYGAFDLCAPALTFICSETSYAAGYAKSYGIRVVEP